MVIICQLKFPHRCMQLTSLFFSLLYEEIQFLGFWGREEKDSYFFFSYCFSSSTDYGGIENSYFSGKQGAVAVSENMSVFYMNQ